MNAKCMHIIKSVENWSTLLLPILILIKDIVNQIRWLYVKEKRNIQIYRRHLGVADKYSNNMQMFGFFFFFLIYIDGYLFI